MAKTLDLFEGTLPLVITERKFRKSKSGVFISNPCIAVYGKGPDGIKCKSCEHLLVRKFSKWYFKCALRKISSSPATDHRVNWPACSKYHPIPGFVP